MPVISLDNGMNLPEFRKGIYRLLYDLSVKVTPGLQADRNVEGVPGKRLPGILPAGEIVYIYEVRYLSVSVWGRCRWGWICLFMNETYYVVLVEE